MSQWTEWTTAGRARQITISGSSNWDDIDNVLSNNGQFSTINSTLPNLRHATVNKSSDDLPTSVPSNFGLTTSVFTNDDVLRVSTSTATDRYGFDPSVFLSSVDKTTLENNLAVIVAAFNFGDPNIYSSTLYLDQFSFPEIKPRDSLVSLQRRVVASRNSTRYRVAYAEVRIEYTPFVFPWTNPSASPSVFSATIDSEIETYDSPSISERGVVYSTSPNPTTADTKIIASGTTIGEYSSSLTGLTENTTYYVRSYAIDTGETYYSQEIEFTTQDIPWFRPTDEGTDLFNSTIGSELGSYVTSTITERGIVFSTAPSPTTSDTKLTASGTTTGTFTNNITGLDAGTTYYIRSFVTDNSVTYYSPELEITTLTINLPFADTTEVTAFTATLSATIDPAFSLNVVERGFVYSTIPDPDLTRIVEVVGDGDGDYSATITGLDPETEYFVRAYFKYVNSPEVTVYSEESSFVTDPALVTRKSFTYKFFEPDGTYIGTYYTDYDFQVQNSPEFTQVINGGRGDLVISQLASATDYQEYAASTRAIFIQVIVHDRETPATGEIIYTGRIISNKYSLQSNGFISLDDFLYISGEFDMNVKLVETIGGDTTISYNDDPAEILKDLLDLYQLKGGFVTYTGDSIKTVGSNLAITFKNETYLEAVKRLAQYLPIDWYWYIDGNNVFYLDQTDFSTIDHELTIGQEVVAGEFVLSFGEMSNAVFFFGGDTGTAQLYEKYINNTSQQTFGVFDRVVVDERVTTSSTAQLWAERILRDGITPVRYITFEVIDSNGATGGYDIESIKVGDVVSVTSPEIPTQRTLWSNEAGTVGNMVWGLSFWGYDVDASLGVPFQVQEVRYRAGRAIVKASDVLQDTASEINQLRKRSVIQATLNSPDTPA